jgi:hypothetical protein
MLLESAEHEIASVPEGVSAGPAARTLGSTVTYCTALETLKGIIV